MQRVRLARRLIIILSLCLLFFGASSYVQQNLLAASGDGGRRSIERLRVALEPQFPPFEFIGASGVPEGFDIDFLDALSKELGFRVELQLLAFDDLLPAIQSSNADASISALSITDDRKKIVAFSRPYFKGGLTIAVRENDIAINSLETLQGKRVGVQKGSTGAEEAKQVTGSQIKEFDSTPDALRELSEGRLDAAINDAAALYYAIRTEGIENIKVIGDFITEEFYGIAMPKDSPYVETINSGIRTLMENGKYAEIYRKYFNANPPLLPSA
ncbi:basic amino acid ABC transporter substrate-binding protein [Leptolyngbya ohadii]|uniref:basic amino acid ABC transporter substrate-binding protein n=1 Tax=Leptolyngbya ohadii TaxID=1962290 RepID=UPI000B598C89|nr:basic amino acid ABC transporter substrate-binding protein [Leptolyngbya ohadii]